MKSLPAILIAAAAALSTPLPAHAADLTVVNVSAPAVNCVFNASCTVVVTDSVGTLEYTPLGSGAFLQSRTYAGQPAHRARAPRPTSIASISRRRPITPNVWPGSWSISGRSSS